MLMQLHSICPNMNNEGLVNMIARTLNIKLETGDIVVMPVSVSYCIRNSNSLKFNAFPLSLVNYCNFGINVYLV